MEDWEKSELDKAIDLAEKIVPDLVRLCTPSQSLLLLSLLQLAIIRIWSTDGATTQYDQPMAYLQHFLDKPEAESAINDLIKLFSSILESSAKGLN